MLSKFQIFSFFAVVTLASLATDLHGGRPLQYFQIAESTLVSGLSVTTTSPSSVSLSWDAWAGTGYYTVTVRNLTTNQVEQTFTTLYTTISISSLSHSTYRFTVEKAGYVIAEDVIM